MQSKSLTVDNIDLEDVELYEAIQNYNRTLPRGQACLKVMKWPDQIVPADCWLCTWNLDNNVTC